MKKGMVVLLTMGLVVLGVAQVFAKQFNQKELQQCMEQLKRASAKKGYPITDPMVLRYKCIDILKKK